MFSPLSSNGDAMLSRLQGQPYSSDNWHNCPEHGPLQSQEGITGQPGHDSSSSGWGYGDNAWSTTPYVAARDDTRSDRHSHNFNTPRSPHWGSPGSARRDRRNPGTPNAPSENWSATLDKPPGGKSRNNNQYFIGKGGQHQYFEGEQSQHWTQHGSKSDRGGKGREQGVGWLGSPRWFSRRETLGQQTPDSGKGTRPNSDGMLYCGTELRAGTGEAPPHQSSDHGGMSRRNVGQTYSATQGTSGSGRRNHMDTRRSARGTGSPRSPPYGCNSPQSPYYCRSMDSSMSPLYSSTPLTPMASLTPLAPSSTPLGSPPEGVRARLNNSSGNPHSGDTMKQQLQALQLEDPATVFIARRINKLGFSSADHLRAYFSHYGEVKDVYVSHSRVKSMRPLGERRMPDGTHWRLRAAALGFLVMTTAEARTRILVEGPEHTVNNVVVRVHPFHRRSYADVSDPEDADEGDAPPRGSQQSNSMEDASASEVAALYESYAMGDKHASDEGNEPEGKWLQSGDMSEVP